MALEEDKLTTKSKVQLLFLCGLILILFSGLRGPNVDRDQYTYKAFYDKAQNLSFLLNNPQKYFKTIRYEPSLQIVFSSFKSLFQNGFPIAIFSYALLGVLLKIFAIKKISDKILLSLLLYYSTIFLLQDMTQIRIGVAIGFVFLSIPTILERNLLRFSLLILLGVFFHYSVIVFAPFYFINHKKINKTFYLLILVIPIFLHLSNFNPLYLLTKFDFGIYSEKLNAYVEMQKWRKESINMFNFSILLQIMFSFIFVVFNEKIENKYAIILTKIYCYGVAAFYLLSFSPVIAFRLSEVLTCVQILLLPMLLSIIKPRVVAETLLIVISILYFLNIVLINNIFKSYSTIFY